MPRGILISFDGLDSSGKQTQAKQLKERLEKLGHTVHVFQTPDYDTPSGQDLKARLQGKKGNWEETTWQEKLGYFANNRTEHLDEVNEALSKGEIVIYDRYIPSSLAFMAVEARLEDESSLREAVHQHVKKVEYDTNHMPKEDVSFFMDMTPQVADRLLNERKQNHHEEDEYTDKMEVQQGLYDEYDNLCNTDPGKYVRVPCQDGDQLRSIEDISSDVWRELINRQPQLQE